MRFFSLILAYLSMIDTILNYCPDFGVHYIGIAGNFNRKAYHDAFWAFIQLSLSEFNQALYVPAALILAAGNQKSNGLAAG